MLELTTTVLVVVSAPSLVSDWKTVTSDGVTVRSRSFRGSPIREFWSDATIKASIMDVQNVLLDVEKHPSFMPHVAELKILELAESGRVRLVYARLEFPVVRSRDFVVQTTVDRSVTKDGGTEFATHWVSLPDKVPIREHVVRVRVNEGSWKATRVSDDLTHLTYRFRVDPGGWIPPPLASAATRRSIPSVFKALEAEAGKRRAARSPLPTSP